MKKQARLYDNDRWRKVRKRFLSSQDNCLCIMCRQMGALEPATVVDHKIPHENDPALFWDETNFQPLCATCHSSLKQSQEIHGYSQATNQDGTPFDPNHPWNKVKR